MEIKASCRHKAGEDRGAAGPCLPWQCPAHPFPFSSAEIAAVLGMLHIHSGGAHGQKGRQVQIWSRFSCSSDGGWESMKEKHFSSHEHRSHEHFLHPLRARAAPCMGRELERSQGWAPEPFQSSTAWPRHCPAPDSSEMFGSRCQRLEWTCLQWAEQSEGMLRAQLSQQLLLLGAALQTGRGFQWCHKMSLCPTTAFSHLESPAHELKSCNSCSGQPRVPGHISELMWGQQGHSLQLPHLHNEGNDPDLSDRHFEALFNSLMD